MSDRERAAWDRALRISRSRLPIDERYDRMAAWANNAEDCSVRAELKGRHSDAEDYYTVSILLDSAMSSRNLWGEHV